MKWLLEYRLTKETQYLANNPNGNESTTLEEIQLNIKQLRDELQRIHPANQAREDLSGICTAVQHSIALSEHEASTGLSTLSTRPLIRVCDIIRTEIVGVEVIFDIFCIDSLE